MTVEPSVERIHHGKTLLAILIRRAHRADGIDFLTPPELSQQLAYMNRPRGHVVAPHVHNPVPRQVHQTQEVLFIRSGAARLDLYSDEGERVCSRTLAPGDVVLLAGGGHGLEMLEPTEIIEVKQGPYAGQNDKTHL